MTTSSASSLLEEIREKRRRLRLAPLAWTAAVVLGLIAFATVPIWLAAVFVILSGIGVSAAHLRDALSLTCVIMYDLESEMEESYDRLIGSIHQMGKCAGQWHIRARGAVRDRKYHAGASQLVDRKTARIGSGQPSRVQTNVTPAEVKLAHLSLYFLPDFVLVCSSKIGAVGYDELQLIIEETRFVEEGWVPTDAKVVDHTWRYVNKSGGPDRRFRDNPQIPICLYEQLWLMSPSGLNEILQLSRTGRGAAFKAAVEEHARLLAEMAKAKPVLPVAQEVREAEVVAPATAAIPNPSPAAIEEPSCHPDAAKETLLEMLCCVMVSDGRASAIEKQAIYELMASNWDCDEVDRRIGTFIERIRKEGSTIVFQQSLAKAKALKAADEEATVVRALERVARANGQLTQQEVRMCRRLAAAIREAPSG